MAHRRFGDIDHVSMIRNCSLSRTGAAIQRGKCVKSSGRGEGIGKRMLSLVAFQMSDEELEEIDQCDHDFLMVVSRHVRRWVEIGILHILDVGLGLYTSYLALHQVSLTP